LYKTVLILYLAIFSAYVLFSRVPDYFNGDYIKGTVTKASFSEEKNSPEVVVDYRVGSETFQYKTDMWFLTSYKPGQRVTIIYDPDRPMVSCIYAFIGYWIKWPEIIFTSTFFILLFLVAKSITGENVPNTFPGGKQKKKRKYDD
jgi:hypothetical protein